MLQKRVEVFSYSTQDIAYWIRTQALSKSLTFGSPHKNPHFNRAAKLLVEVYCHFLYKLSKYASEPAFWPVDLIIFARSFKISLF
jgi:hypothetical protein